MSNDIQPISDTTLTGKVFGSWTEKITGSDEVLKSQSTSEGPGLPSTKTKDATTCPDPTTDSCHVTQTHPG